MRVVGLPEHFWVVTTPTAESEIGDICFECDFRTFALQVRGGLDVEKVVGIFANEEAAVELAEHLLQAAEESQPEADIRVHRSPWPEWFATQESLTGVFLCNKSTGEKVKIEPPKEWGRNWAWNFTEDGTGIFIRHT
jgi:hypothetical protein